jgi:bifunctional non-homologous end joining protein LigD
MAAASDAEPVLVEVDGRRLKLSNLDKVLFPATGTTKAELISYYTGIAPALLPHLRDRPVTLVRAPDGIAGGRFFEKNLPRGAPEWFRTIPVPTSGRRSTSRGRGGEINYPAIGDLASLVWIVNLAAIELHVPQWRVDEDLRPCRPDLVVFDLDPGEGVGLTECAQVALWLRQRLLDEGLEALPKTSGSKGLQLYARVPADGSLGETAEYAHHVARSVEREHRAQVVSNMRKDLRRGHVLIDWSQNNPAKTTVAPYSVRLRERPTVSCPLTWEEVEQLVEGGDEEAVQLLPLEMLEREQAVGDLFERLSG